MLFAPLSVTSAMQLPDAVAFSFFGMKIFWYGVFMAIGVLLAIVLANLDAKRRALPADTAVDLCLVALPCGIVGARIGYILLHLSYYVKNPVRMLYIWDGGLWLVGAAVFALIGILIYGNKKKLRFLKLLDVLVPGIAAAIAVGSWGLFFNQEFYGPIVTAKAFKWFPLCVRLDDGSIHLALFFLLFVVMAALFVFLWLRLRKTARHDGDVTFAFLLVSGLTVSVFSFLRADGSRADHLPEIIGGAVVFVLTLAFLIVRALHEKKLGTTIWPAPEKASEGEVDEDEAAGDVEDAEAGEEEAAGDVEEGAADEDEAAGDAEEAAADEDEAAGDASEQSETAEASDKADSGDDSETESKDA